MEKKSRSIYNYLPWLIVITLSVLVAGCTDKKTVHLEKDKDPVVSVYDKILYRGDLENSISERILAGDSATAADAYIKMWINEELIYEKARQNITDQHRINELVENYRQSLTVFTYLEQLLKEELSKKITESDMKEYYDKNTDNLKLESSLVKGLFLKIPRSSPELKNLQQWYKQNTGQAKENIEKASIQNAVIFDYFYDKWISIDDILSNMPIPINNPNEFVKSNKNFEAEDSTYVYLLHIEEYALAGTNAPYIFAKPKITDILINQKRDSFLKQFEKDLYDKAIKEEDVKFYIQQKLEQ